MDLLYYNVRKRKRTSDHHSKFNFIPSPLFTSSHRKKMIGITNELMHGLPSSRMTLKVFYSESVAVVLVNLCWRMGRPRALSQVLNDATTCSVRTRVSSITMLQKTWLGFQFLYKNLRLFVRVAKARSIIKRLGFIQYLLVNTSTFYASATFL